MRVNYCKYGKICTEINADYKNNKVTIKNHTDYFLDKAFGNNNNPTIEDFESLIEDRCFPKTRDKLALTLKLHNIKSGYNPFVIAKQLNGRVAGDNYSLEFLDGDEAYERKSK